MNNQILTGLYEMYSREIFLYLYSMCRDRETAEDVMQECFVRAILSLPDSHTNMRAWLYRVARNALFDELRHRSPEEPLPDAGDLSDESGDPLDAYIRNEERKKLLRLIAGLDRRKREVLILQYFSRLSQKEIAALLHTTHENVRVLSLRAKRELKRKMEEDGYEIP